MPWHGPTSLRGRDGPPGPQGEPGEDAPVVPGPQGPQGAAGATGPTGATGSQGAMGPPGWQGEPGEDGAPVPGPTGATGAAGSTGPTGAQGPIGPPGMQGDGDWEELPRTPPPPGAGDSPQFANLGLGVVPSTGGGQINVVLGANGLTAIKVKRFTNVSVSGYLLDFVGATGGSVFQVDALGNVQVGRWIATAIEAVAGGTGLDSSAWALGDLPYISAAGVWNHLAGNVTATRKWLRQTGNGTISAAPAWDTIQGGDVPAFVAAGASHAAGTVPDPGATAYTNHPRLLTSQASFVAPSGKVLDYNYVSTQQSTSSSSLVDLATVDQVEFTLDAAGDVVILYSASEFNTVSGGENSVQVYYSTDGSTYSAIGDRLDSASTGASKTFIMTLMIKHAAAAGTNYYRVRHAAHSGGGSANAFARNLMATLVN